jgi:nucleoside-diphosphate-sugar epimerase
MQVTVTGGAGYIGALLVEELRAGGHGVTVLDVLLHRQQDVGRRVADLGARLVQGDVRDADTRRAALEGAEAVVHLAAIVGDPACARDPALSQAVNVDASRALLDDAGELAIDRFVFASTCSNYGRMADPTVPIDEEGALSPVSLYAEQKVEVEKLLRGSANSRPATTCLRFATVYGGAPRMRFDLTVNEFTRDLWTGRDLEVFGERFWRPYLHVRDAARAVRTALQAPRDFVASEVFNVGHSDENYRKLDLVEVIIGKLGRGNVKYVYRDEDPRDYKVSFEKVRDKLDFEPLMRVPHGVEELIEGLEHQRYGDPFDPRHSNLTAQI